MEQVTETCPRCKGTGKKEPVLIAGQLVGGDTVYLCHRCRGKGTVTYAVWPKRAEA